MKTQYSLSTTGSSLASPQVSSREHYTDITVDNKRRSPEISVLLPCYNACTTIARSIESLLSQSMTDFELIIINDGSTDGSHQIIDKYRDIDDRIVTIHLSQNKGLAHALNLGIKTSQAQLIARIDADDWCDALRLEKQYQFMMAHPQVDILGTGMKLINVRGEIIKDVLLPEYHDTIIARAFNKPMLYHPTVMIRKVLFDRYGDYDQRLDWAEDADLWYRIYDKVAIHNLPEALVYYSQKSKINYHIARKNLSLKYRHLKANGMLRSHAKYLIRDFVTYLIRMVNNNW